MGDMSSDRFRLDGQTALVTAIDRDLGASNTGAAYVFAVPEPASGAALIMALLTWMRAGRRRDGSGLL